MKYSVAVLSWTLLCVIEIEATTREGRQCCDSGELSSSSYLVCNNGKKISITCKDDKMAGLDTYKSDYPGFYIQEDEEYLRVYGVSYIWREPYYCIGNYGDSRSITTAIVCKEERESLENSRRNWYQSICIVLNIISTLALAVTAFLYCFVREVQDTQGNCMFHLSVVMFILHLSICYALFFNPIILFMRACITSLYLAVYLLMAVFTWCAIVNHNSWIHSKAVVNVEDGRLMTWYRYFGYGFPILIVILCNLAAHVSRLYTNFELAWNCDHHTDLIVVFFLVVIPILAFSAASCFFFFDTQRRLWNSPSLKMRSEGSTLRMMKYRLILNGKLVIITGITWPLFIFLLFLYIFLGHRIIVLKYCLGFFVLLISAEGFFIFLILVAFRKRVLKAICRHPFISDTRIIPARWKTMKDSETGVESEEDDIQDTRGQTSEQ